MFIVFCAVKYCVFMTCSTLFCLCGSLVDPMNVTVYVCTYVNLIYILLLDLPIGVFLHDETHTTVSVSGVSPFISCVRVFLFM
jgi:hypothetical protein